MALTKVTTGTIADDSIESLKNRNLIINGAMTCSQRATQVTGVTTSGYRTCDRAKFDVINLGAWTVDQSADAPNGFSNSFKLTCTTADASPAAADAAYFIYYIEAQNLQHLAFGNADAKSLTFSFWVKSNKTGSASFEALQADNAFKMISKSYTINSADTWEYKTISIPADTAGLINNDNGQGLSIGLWLNSGSDYSSGSHATTWSTYDATKRNASNLGVGGAVSDYFAITGVQLEVGDVATPFEHESYGDTLAKCQRYFQIFNIGRIGGVLNSSGVGIVSHQTVRNQRATASASVTGTLPLYYMNGASQVSTSVNSFSYGAYGINLGKADGSGGGGLSFWCDLNSTNYINFDAEL